jgi:hypothetical protein
VRAWLHHRYVGYRLRRGWTQIAVGGTSPEAIKWRKKQERRDRWKRRLFGSLDEG